MLVAFNTKWLKQPCWPWRPESSWTSHKLIATNGWSSRADSEDQSPAELQYLLQSKHSWPSCYKPIYLLLLATSRVWWVVWVLVACSARFPMGLWGECNCHSFLFIAHTCDSVPSAELPGPLAISDTACRSRSPSISVLLWNKDPRIGVLQYAFETLWIALCKHFPYVIMEREYGPRLVFIVF